MHDRGEDRCHLPLLAADRATAATVREELERLMREDDVFRGKVLSFGRSVHRAGPARREPRRHRDRGRHGVVHQGAGAQAVLCQVADGRPLDGETLHAALAELLDERQALTRSILGGR